MNEANHSLSTFRIELILKWYSLIVQFLQQSVNLLEVNESILCNVLSNVVSKISSESQLILKLNMHSLIVIIQPCSLQRLLTIFGITIFAESSLDGVIRSDHYLPEVLLLKFPLMILCNHLHPVRQLMCANFSLFEKIESLWLL